MKPRLEKWRDLVIQELKRARAPFPPEYVMSIIERESKGRAGALNPTAGDSGLMQVIPKSLRHYNNNHSRKHTLEQLRSSDRASAAIQIRVGLWILSQFTKSAYRYLKQRLPNVPVDDLMKVTDTFYASGPGRVKPKLDRIAKPTWDAIKARYPGWHRIEPAEFVWNFSKEGGANWDLPLMDQWLEGEIVVEDKTTISGALIGILIIMAAMMFFKGRK